MSLHKQGHIRSVHVGQTQVLAKGHPTRGLFDPYHFVLTLSWPRFFGLLVLLFFSLNLCFALAYWLVPGSVANARPGMFWDHFFFSVETLATVGYGEMSPATTAGHIIAVVEIMFGMAILAVTTGLIFARFAKPKARIMFSSRAVIRQFDGQRVLMLRMANERYNRIVDVSAMMSIVRIERLKEGEPYFRIHDLKLRRERTQVFNLTWTLIHEINEHSPLHGLTSQDLAASQARIAVSIAGHDETVAATVHAVHDYEWPDIVFDGRFADVLREMPDGSRVVDLTRFHEVERGPATP